MKRPREGQNSVDAGLYKYMASVIHNELRARGVKVSTISYERSSPNTNEAVDGAWTVYQRWGEGVLATTSWSRPTASLPCHSKDDFIVSI